MSERKVRLEVDGHQWEVVVVETRVSQGLPVLPILVAVYLSEILKEVKKEVEECMATSFVDDCRWMVKPDLIAQLSKLLERAGKKAVEWGEDNHVELDNRKDGAIAFTKRWELELKKRIAEVKVIVHGHNVGFNTEAPR